MVGTGVQPAEAPQDVRYTYWPVHYKGGDPTVISATPLPLSGVQYSQVARGVGELRASLQLADPDVRAIKPWEVIYARKTGIVAVRSVRDASGAETHVVVWHGIIWENPTDASTGRMEITAQTVESLWARRCVTGPPRSVGWVPTPADPGELSWAQADQATMAADLLDPSKFSQLGTGALGFPGWITVDPPGVTTGVLRDFTYKRNQQTNLLEAHQDRSKVINGYEWTTTTKVLSGTDAYSASTYRCQFILGYPRLGRQYGVSDVPRVSYFVDGRGNALPPKYAHSGLAVPNAVWGNGSGLDDATVRALATNTQEWDNGFLITESRYSNPDVSVQATLQDYTNAAILQALANEIYISELELRGDLQPYFGSYVIGDDLILVSDDWTLPDLSDGTREKASLTRIMGWRVTPPEGNGTERVSLMLGTNGVDLG
jgi:hypothetical protein